jgi:exodeoxyribonuclease V alpha subunit
VSAVASTAATASADPDVVVLAGEVAHVVYEHGESGFRVLRVLADEACGGGQQTVVGRTSSIGPGDRVRAVGRWERGKYGRQLRAESLQPEDAVSDDGMAKSLANMCAAKENLVAGLGIARARRLVAQAGGAAALVALLDGGSDLWLADRSLSWLPASVKDALANAWRESRVEREVEARLSTLEIAPALRAKLRARYGADAGCVVLEEPYRLARDIDGVGFLTADDIAMRVGVGKDSEERVDAAVAHVLRVESEEGGHTRCSVDDVAKGLRDLFMRRPAPARFARDPRGESEAALGRALSAGMVDLCRGDDNAVALPHLLAAERTIALALRSAMTAVDAVDSGPEYPPSAVGDPIADLTDEQRVAVEAVFTRGVAVLTGGPGVGKSFTCMAIVDRAEAVGMLVRLCAPTARAAKRLSEATGRDATTIHRLLEAQGDGRFLRNAENRIDGHLIVVDESSMVSVDVMAALLSAVPAGCRVVLVGDKDQLPPVGAGAPFRDVIASGAVPVARLTKVHRQAAGSAIVRAAHAVLHGSVPLPSPEGDRTDGCLHMVRASAADSAATVVEVVCSLKQELGADPFDSMVLAPMRKGPCGVDALNLLLQERLNPPTEDKPEVTSGTKEYARTYRLGDRVRQTKNDYGREVVNGDVGRVVEVEGDERRRRDGHAWLKVDFGPGVGVVAYGKEHLRHLVLSYCSTIHACQGGESKAVVLAMVDAHYVMLSRTLLYTGITRAKRACVIVGSRRAVEQAARNARDDARRTSLPGLLAAGSVVVESESTIENGGP